MKAYFGEIPINLIKIVNAFGDVDLSQDTVNPNVLVEGYTAHNSMGEFITGINPYEKSSTDAAIANIVTAIASKGVTIPPNYTLNDLADLINSIQVGGNGAVVSSIINSDGTQTIVITE